MARQRGARWPLLLRRLPRSLALGIALLPLFGGAAARANEPSGRTTDPAPSGQPEPTAAEAPAGAHPAGCEGPAGADHGLVVGRSAPLCAGARSVTAMDGLLLVGRLGLEGGAQAGVVALVPAQSGWPRLFMATGKLSAADLGRLHTSVSAAVGLVRLPDRDRTAGLLQVGVAADRPAGTSTAEAAWRRAVDARLGLHLGLSGWTGAGQPLGTPIELSRGGALLVEGGADLQLTEHLSFTLEALAPVLVLDKNTDQQAMIALPYGLRAAGERIRVDLGFIKGTGAAAGLDALRIGFPLLSVTAQQAPGPRGLGR